MKNGTLRMWLGRMTRGAVLLIYLTGLVFFTIRIWPDAHALEKLREEREIQKLFRDLVPIFDNQPWKERRDSKEGVFFQSVHKGTENARIYRLSDRHWLKPSHTLLAAVDPEGNLTGVKVLEHPETEAFEKAHLEGPLFQEALLHRASKGDASIRNEYFSGMARRLEELRLCLAKERGAL